MQDLIAEVGKTTGLTPERTEQALGIMLNLLRTQGNREKTDALFEKLPGAVELAKRHGGMARAEAADFWACSRAA